MSRGPARLFERAGAFSKFVVPAAAGLTLVALVIGRPRKIDRDLHLLAPARAGAGERLPLRARLYTGLDRPEGPELTREPIEVELRQDSEVLARTRLAPSFAGSLDGELRVPPGLSGRFALAARSAGGAEPVTVERTLWIGPEPPAQPLSPRALSPLARLSHGPLWPSAAAAELPSSVRARIRGGACVPESPCRVLVYVGEPAAAVRVLPTGSVSAGSRGRSSTAESSGAVALEVVTHGPEAHLELAIERGGARIGRRSIQLAVDLGASAALALPPLITPGESPAAGLHGSERGCIVDGFAGGRWLHTGGLAACDGSEPLPFAPLEPGRAYRLQLRRDPFASRTAAVVAVYVRRAGESDPELLAALARAALERAPTDPLARAVQTQPTRFAGALEVTAGYLLALLETGVHELPAPASSHPRARRASAAATAKVRKLALFVLALCGLVLALLVALRGLAAAGEAGRLMQDAGETPAELDRQRLRMIVRVLLAVASVLLAFAAIAAYVIARGAAP